MATLIGRFDQVVHDVALQKLPVRFAMDRAGLVGEDGPTHAGAYDVTFMACLPDMAGIGFTRCMHTTNQPTTFLSNDHPSTSGVYTSSVNHQPNILSHLINPPVSRLFCCPYRASHTQPISELCVPVHCSRLPRFSASCSTGVSLTANE